MTRSRLLVLALVAAAVAVAVVLWPSRESGKPSDSKTVDAASARLAPPVRASGVTGGTSAAVTTETHTEGEKADEDVTTQLEDAVTELKRIARPCAADRVTTTDDTLDKLVFRASLTYSGGVASVASFELVESDLHDETLEACVLAALRAASWDTDLPDGEIHLQPTLNVGDLMAPAPMTPPKGPPQERAPIMPSVPKPTAPPPPM